jgi:hypothetical protein
MKRVHLVVPILLKGVVEVEIPEHEGETWAAGVDPGSDAMYAPATVVGRSHKDLTELEVRTATQVAALALLAKIIERHTVEVTAATNHKVKKGADA